MEKYVDWLVKFRLLVERAHVPYIYIECAIQCGTQNDSKHFSSIISYKVFREFFTFRISLVAIDWER